MNMSKDSNTMNMSFENTTIQRYSEVDLFSTQGRMGRKRYFVYSIILPLLLFWAVASIAGILSHLGGIATAISYAVIALALTAMVFMLIRLTIQRCHDFNKSGALALLAVIPFANLVFALIPGTNGLNQYGEVPQPANTFFKACFYILLTLSIIVATWAAVKLLNAPISQLLATL